MTSQNSLGKKISDIEKALQDFISDINLLINNLPDNPNINRIKVNVFTIQKSKLDSNILSAEYYDFKYQYRNIIVAIERAHSYTSKLKQIISQGFVVVNMGKIPLHPHVIENLKSIL